MLGRGVIFDMDGCLVDSEPLSLNAIVEELRQLGLNDASTEELGARFLGVSLSRIEAFAAERLGHAVPAGFATRIETALIDTYRSELRTIDGADNMLGRLARDGVALALATGASVGRMQATLDIAGLAHHFTERAVSADDVANGKPAPDVFLEAARRLDLPPSACIVVEDSPHGVLGAVRAGMTALGFVGGSHLVGRRDEQGAVLRDAGAEHVFRNLQEVTAFLMVQPKTPTASRLG